MRLLRWCFGRGRVEQVDEPGYELWLGSDLGRFFIYPTFLVTAHGIADGERAYRY